MDVCDLCVSTQKFARIQSVTGQETLAKVLAWRRFRSCDLHHHKCRVLPMGIKASFLAVTVHYGYLFHLLLVSWAELAAGRVIPTNTTETPWNDMQSVLGSLQGALKEYNRSLSAVSLHANLHEQKQHFHRPEVTTF